MPAPAAGPVDYQRDIAPIFAKSCYSCHSKDKQKGGLRLDLKAAALQGGDEHAPDIIPGNSSASPLIRFVAGVEQGMIMPAQGERLTDAQIRLLRAWIDQGAPWPDIEQPPAPSKLDWWSLRPLRRPAVPEFSQPGIVPPNAIDAFIRAKLREHGLSPSPEADRRTLIRRVYFDLIGLPPAPEEIDTFIADPDVSAYEKLVDRLLASPHYGERWARHWLDVVHYGDTHGYDKDQPRPNAWPYRDYVVRAFNQDKPYARFVQEQIAGDALFPNDPDGVEALGFIAAGPWDQIGHAEVPESKTDGKIARLLDRDDMVSNTMNTFCSLTIQCARCHNHKFDPVTQLDYYRLQSVFAALDRTDKPYDTNPELSRQRVRLVLRQRALAENKKKIEAQVLEAGGKELEALDKAIAAAKQSAKGEVRPEFGWHSAIEPSPDRTKWVQVDLGTSVAIQTIEYVGCHDDFNHLGAGFGFPARYKVEISDDERFSQGVQMVEDRTEADVPNPGVAVQRIRVEGKRARYVRVTATKLAPRKDDYIFALAELSVFNAAGTNLALGVSVSSLDSIEAPPRWSRQNLVDGYYYGLTTREPVADVAAWERARTDLISRTADPVALRELESTRRELEAVAAALAKLPPPKLVYAGTVHYGSGAFAGTGANGGKPRPIFLLARGDVRKPLEEVGPGTVPLIPGLPATFELPADHPETARRVALAKWLTDERSPLTWRSIVNRVWQYHFGVGIVPSANDFGRMGQLPTHPELLDWLAVEFRDGGQSFKQLHRLIVTSATYRQVSNIREWSSAEESGTSSTSSATSFATPTSASAVDADNRLLWRMNRRKLEAEAVRDAVLSVAGELDLTLGGPGFKDFVVEKPEHSPHYQYDLADPDDPKTHRRSLYRFIVRSQPQPFMSALDCADPSASVDRRNETLNALQALALLNDKLMITMAKHFAARVEKIAPSLDQQVEAAFRLALGRPPTFSERQVLTPFVTEQGLANACRVIFNLNEFVFVD